MDVGVTPRATGFTLVEMLVVVAILSVLAIGASLSATRVSPSLPGPLVWQQACRDARDRAVLSGHESAMYLYSDHWEAARRGPGGTWQPDGAASPWNGRARLIGRSLVPRKEQDADTRVSVIFLPDGRMSALDLRVSDAVDGSNWRCRTDGVGPLDCVVQP